MVADGLPCTLRATNQFQIVCCLADWVLQRRHQLTTEGEGFLSSRGIVLQVICGEVSQAMNEFEGVHVVMRDCVEQCVGWSLLFEG